MVHFKIDARTVNAGDPDATDKEVGSETAANAVARFSPRSEIRKATMVDIAVSSDNLHFFDARTRQRVQ
jgi:hypothetical protein